LRCYWLYKTMLLHERGMHHTGAREAPLVWRSFRTLIPHHEFVRRNIFCCWSLPQMHVCVVNYDTLTKLQKEMNL
jgi:hypothetical protein